MSKSPTVSRRLAALRLLVPVLLAAAVASQAQAQAIERHFPAAPKGAQGALVVPNALPGDQDATPIGPALRAVVLLGPTETAHAVATDGLTIGDVARLRADQEAVNALMRPFIGQPMSRKLIAEIEAALAGRYRDLRYPFVSFSTPEQEIGGGALQVRVIEFVAGEVTLRGARSDAEAAALRARISLRDGAPIDARELGQDLDSLNRYPFRQVQAVFSPGAQLGVSNLALMVQNERPWQAYAGYGNDGSPSTSLGRYFLGGSIGGVLGRDSVLSAQFTASQDWFAGRDDPDYQGAALNYVLPIGRRSQIEASADVVETHQALAPFAVRMQAVKSALGSRATVGDWFGGQAASDVRFGVEAKRQVASTYFSGIDVYGVAMNVYQFYAGYHRTGRDALGVSNLDLAVRASPGGLDAASSDARAVLFSQGRMKRADCGYVSLDYNRVTPLRFDMALKTQLIGQYASNALPRTEQAGLGGMPLVRGYTLDDGAFDSVLILRNELHFPKSALSPYLFVDAGQGRDNAAHTTSALYSSGIGAQLRLTRHLLINLDAARAFDESQDAQAGDWRIHANLTVAF